MSKKRKKKILRIKWVDSCEHYGWIDVEDCHSCTKIITIGIMVSETEDSVIISSSYSFEFKNYVSPLTIPRRCIESIEVIGKIKLKD